MRDKTVVARDEYLAKIRAAVDAKGDADFFLVARTDAIADGGLDEALARAEAARAAGADATFVEAPRSLDELTEIGRRAPKPTVANMIEQGRTPLRPRDDLAALGFQLVLYPLTGLYAAARALEAVYGSLLADGTSAGVAGSADRVREVQPDRRGRREARPRRGLRAGDEPPRGDIMPRSLLTPTGGDA